MKNIAKGAIQNIISIGVEKFLEFASNGDEVGDIFDNGKVKYEEIKNMFEAGLLQCQSHHMSSMVYNDENTNQCTDIAVIPVESYRPAKDSGPQTWYLCEGCSIGLKELIHMARTIPLESRVGKWSMLNNYGLPDDSDPDEGWV